MRNKAPAKELRELEDLKATLSKVIERIEGLQLSLENRSDVDPHFVVGDIVKTKNRPYARGVVHKINTYFVEIKTDIGIVKRARKNLVKVENGIE